MSFFIGFLTFVLVIDSLLLILLVLIQLPKKEAGAGVAFGGGATDALFGAGSGNALTRITRYAATVFFSLALLISVLYAKHNPKDDSAFQLEVKKQAAAAAAAAAATGQGTIPQPAAVAPSNSPLNILSPGATNPSVAPATTSSAPPAATAPPK
jgi:preprotein translocase subunit SecG